MYKFIKERRSQYAITEEDIKEVEERFDIKFPIALREFYLEHNGDFIKTSCFSIGGETFTLDDMYYIKIKGEAPVELVLQWQREDGYISSDLIPFACDCGGESYYWSTEDEKVYFIDGMDLENPMYICESIDAFFKIMEEAEPF